MRSLLEIQPNSSARPAREGRIRARKDSRGWRFNAADLERYMRARKPRPAPKPRRPKCWPVVVRLPDFAIEVQEGQLASFAPEDVKEYVRRARDAALAKEVRGD